LQNHKWGRSVINVKPTPTAADNTEINKEVREQQSTRKSENSNYPNIKEMTTALSCHRTAAH